MKQLFFLLIIFPTLGFAQPESEVSKKISEQFEEHYNAGEYEKIFDMFSKYMQSFLPSNKTFDFLNGLKSQAGDIKSMDFVGYENGSYASYKTQFDRGLFQVNISTDKKSKINGLFVKPYKDKSLAKLERNTTKMILPFKGEWDVFWGGDTKELNYHVVDEAQKNAFDILIMDVDGRSYKTDGKTNEDYYAFGKELIAPCDARVVMVVDGVKDNTPGELNPVYVPGNTVILKTKNNEYLFFAHFKKHSIVVEEGQEVKRGDVLGLCGNSGNSSEAHIHFHIQNVEEMHKATGAKCYFDHIIVNGESKQDYSPIKGDKIRNK